MEPQTLDTIPWRSLTELWPDAKPKEMASDSPGQEKLSPDTNSYPREDQSHWGQMVHRVQAGDSYFGISRMYYGDARHWRSIHKTNRSEDKAQTELKAGQWLYLPTEPLKEPSGNIRKPLRLPDFYIIGKGDQLRQLADWLLGDSNLYPQLAERNKTTINNPDTITPGTMIRISDGE